MQTESNLIIQFCLNVVTAHSRMVSPFTSRLLTTLFQPKWSERFCWVLLLNWKLYLYLPPCMRHVEVVSLLKPFTLHLIKPNEEIHPSLVSSDNVGGIFKHFKWTSGGSGNLYIPIGSLIQYSVANGLSKLSVTCAREIQIIPSWLM